MPGRPAPGLRRAAGLALALGLFAAAPAPAQQEQSFGALLDRLERLERGLEAVRRQVGAPAPGAAAKGSLDAFAGREARFSGIEEQLRSLTDRVERAEFGLRGLVDTLSRDVGDLQRRLAALEAAAPAAPAAAPPMGAEAAAPPAAGGASEAPPPAVTPEGEYERAYELLARADYAGAESALRAFVDRYPEHALSGNAWYWLGETHYARRDFERAAVAFARGYKGFPEGGKTADNLLKLGMSFAAMGRVEEACATFAKLRGDRPDAPAIIRERLAGESARAGCP